MIFIKKSPAPEELEKLKKEAEEQGLSDKEAYDTLRNPLKSQVRESKSCVRCDSGRHIASRWRFLRKLSRAITYVGK